MTRPPLSWAYGVTACAARLPDLLPATLTSLAAAGFTDPRLFVDGAGEPAALSLLPPEFRRLPVSARTPAVGAFGNWWLALVELWVRNPAADRYAVFQDDVLAVRGLRAYLDRTAGHRRAYWNLYTFLDNERVVRGQPVGTWHEGAVRQGRDPANPRPDPLGRQCGAGALGLVFPRDAVPVLLGAGEVTGKPAADRNAKKNIDGAVATALNAAGFREWVHCPSLLFHAGRHSTVEPGKEWVSHAKSWAGEGFDLDQLGR